jgi:hypothetical protein
MIDRYRPLNNLEILMRVCPYCNTALSSHHTFCQVCGYSLVLPLPGPAFPRRRFYLSLSILSIFSGILSCALTFVPSLYMASIFFVIGAIGSAGVTLERSRGKFHTLPIKILAVLGLFFGILGYLSFMFIRSNVPGIGYTM